MAIAIGPLTICKCTDMLWVTENDVGNRELTTKAHSTCTIDSHHLAIENEMTQKKRIISDEINEKGNQTTQKKNCYMKNKFHP